MQMCFHVHRQPLPSTNATLLEPPPGPQAEGENLPNLVKGREDWVTLDVSSLYYLKEDAHLLVTYKQTVPPL